MLLDQFGNLPLCFVWTITDSRINPFLVNIFIFVPLKNPENYRFAGDLRGCKMRTLTKIGLTLAKYLMDSKLDSSNCKRVSDAYCDDLH